MCEECHLDPHFLGSQTWLVYWIACLQCVIQPVNLVRSCFKAINPRRTVTSATIAVCNVWAVAMTSLGARVIVQFRSVVTWRFLSVRVILRMKSFWLRRRFFLIMFLFLQWPTKFYRVARFFAKGAKSSKVLFPFGAIWIVSWIDLVILNYNADFNQSFLNVCEAWVSGVDWSSGTRLL